MFEKEVQLPIKYADKNVGNYRADFVIEGKIILEIKAVEYMPRNYEVQLVRYLKGTDYKLGLLVNFGTKKVQVRRRIA